VLLGDPPSRETSRSWAKTCAQKNTRKVLPSRQEWVKARSNCAALNVVRFHGIGSDFWGGTGRGDTAKVMTMSPEVISPVQGRHVHFSYGPSLPSNRVTEQCYGHLRDRTCRSKRSSDLTYVTQLACGSSGPPILSSCLHFPSSLGRTPMAWKGRHTKRCRIRIATVT
jgi:hypothetical protein